MKKKPNLLALIITLVYWIPSSIVIFSIVDNGGSIFPSWIDVLLLPGYAISYFLSFFGGKPFVLLGQLISFIIIFLLSRIYTWALKDK